MEFLPEAFSYFFYYGAFVTSVVGWPLLSPVILSTPFSTSLTAPLTTPVLSFAPVVEAPAPVVSAALVVSVFVVAAVVWVVAAVVPAEVPSLFLVVPQADRHMTVIMTISAIANGFILFIIHSPFIFYD